MGIYIRGPHLGPVRTTLWSSSGKKTFGPLGYLFGYGMLITAAILYWKVTVAVVVVVALLIAARVVYLRRRIAQATQVSEDAAWKADHVPASPEYKKAHPEGPRDWEPPA